MNESSRSCKILQPPCNHILSAELLSLKPLFLFLRITGIWIEKFITPFKKTLSLLSKHYHKTYAEAFQCVDGEVEIRLDKKIHTLRKGQSATAHPKINHFFRNRSGKPCKFEVELRLASRGFEQSLQIGYGLANDGLCKRNGFPKDKLALAWLFDISESNLPGWMSIFEFILRKQAKKAKQKGIDNQLLEKYVRFQPVLIQPTHRRAMKSPAIGRALISL